jgi:O-antigen/teichoic acid export membrane protein
VSGGPVATVSDAPVRTASLARGMIAGGLPTVLAAGISLAVPLIGRVYLTSDAYAVWALASTVVTMSIVLDFGAPAYVLRVIAIGGSGAKAVVRGILASVAGSLVIGLVGALAWTVYPIRSDVSVAGAGMLLFIGAGAASAVRAVLVVVTSALLAYGSRLHRGLIVLAQALVQLGLTWLLLARGVGVTSLVIATAVSSGIALVAALLVLRRHQTGGDDLPAGEFRTFATSRTVVTMVGLALTQADRWVLGIVAGPGLLADYDTAVRLASIPRVVAINLALVLVADGARRAAQQHALSDLARKATRITVAAVLVSSVGSVVLMVVLSLLSAHSSLVVGSWWMFAGMLVWFGVNAATAPSTLMATGIGRPQEELRYLVPCLLATGICWGVGILVDSTAVMIYGAGAALGLTSLWFLLVRAPRVWATTAT